MKKTRRKQSKKELHIKKRKNVKSKRKSRKKGKKNTRRTRKRGGAPKRKREEEDCAICLDNLSDANQQDKITTKCNHTFHKKCLTTLCKTEGLLKKCPLCRGDISNTCRELLKTEMTDRAKINQAIYRERQRRLNALIDGRDNERVSEIRNFNQNNFQIIANNYNADIINYIKHGLIKVYGVDGRNNVNIENNIDEYMDYIDYTKELVGYPDIRDHDIIKQALIDENTQRIEQS